MDAEGHKTISEVGERLLREKLERSNPSHRMRLGAFYLGNWLTDASQVVDPVAYQNVKGKMLAYTNSIESLFDRMITDAPSWLQTVLDTELGRSALQDVRSELHDAQTKLNESVQALFGQGRSGALADAFRALFKGIGYFKFVLDDQGMPEAMDEASYFAVFDAHFTQYYPHEHMDRPEEGGVYSRAKSKGPLNHRTKSLMCQGDLYTYVRKDIKAVSGLLAYLDGGTRNPCTHPSWAVGTFHPDLKQFADNNGVLQDVSDENIEWNLHLSSLGHALHNIEDYFAHSTFIDHASSDLPGSYKFFSKFEDSDKLARRLKEWLPGFDEETQSWRKLPDDTHVVTGYFDFNDTLVSLGHLLDKVLGRPDAGVGHDIDETIENVLEFEYTRFLTDTLEFVASPVDVWETNDPDNDDYDEETANMAVKWLHEQGGRDLRLLREKDPTLNRLIGLDSVKLLGAVVGGVGMGITLYGALKNVRKFFANPLVFLRAYVGDLIYDYLLRYGEVYIKNLLYVYMGALRIGSHSLIAKDSKPALFSDAALNCAEAVHWDIVTQLTRHSCQSPVIVCRSGEGLDNRAAILQHQWIDWLELMEFFLSHPFAHVETKSETIQLAGNMIHITRTDDHSVMSPDSLASIAAEYRDTHLQVEGGPKELTWEVIADANFPTAGLSKSERMRRINDVLRNQPDAAVLTRDGVNYAFRGGVRIVIPYQRVDVVTRRAKDVQLLWWRSVILDGWRKGKDHLGHEVVSVRFNEQLQLVEEADALRKELEGAYQ
ncbi:MAG: hypothetical protein P8166_01085 [Candidatus Thiodiazotropha sp.]